MFQVYPPNNNRSQSQSTATTGWSGSLSLKFDRHQDQTRLVHNLGHAPLKVQRPFYPEGNATCHSVILHTAGGLVGGDDLAVDVHLAPQAQALITTPAASKIYRSNGLSCQQHVQIQIDAGACLEWLPLETIVFDRAQYRQTVQVELASTAHWLSWDLTRFGRSARGEQFIHGDWRSRTEVWQQGQPLWLDRQWLPGSAENFTHLHGLAACPVVGHFVYIGQAVDPALIEHLRALWHPRLNARSLAQDQANLADEIGVTRLPMGLLCRYRGHSTVAARQWLIEVWRLVRLTLLNKPACIPRVWGTTPDSQAPTSSGSD